jgi:hypothetical protein
MHVFESSHATRVVVVQDFSTVIFGVDSSKSKIKGENVLLPELQSKIYHY